MLCPGSRMVYHSNNSKSRKGIVRAVFSHLFLNWIYLGNPYLKRFGEGQSLTNWYLKKSGGDCTWCTKGSLWIPADKYELLSSLRQGSGVKGFECPWVGEDWRSYSPVWGSPIDKENWAIDERMKKNIVLYNDDGIFSGKFVNKYSMSLSGLGESYLSEWKLFFSKQFD